jgi:outer membrane protein OmpA-like peptidoglycan-associated protein
VAKDFVVYFPFDQYVLTPEAQAVVQQAAQYANDGHSTRVVVVGHTDTSGSAAYNMRLSERRAKATADALVALGVQQSSLNVDWKGKTDLAVPTADGVKEPLNRRSTISINF